VTARNHRPGGRVRHSRVSLSPRSTKKLPEVDQLSAWRADPVLFIETQLICPETGKFFVLNAAETEFLKHAFTLNADGSPKYTELVFGAIKKSGKSAFAALFILVALLLFSPAYSEAICAANGREQAASRIFRALARIVKSSPALAADAVVYRDKVTFKSSQSTVIAVASEAASVAGSDAAVAAFDELWGFTTEADRRLYDELSPPPTRKFAVRLTVSYAGFVGESALLEDLFKKGTSGTPIGDELWEAGELLLAWHSRPVAPWQTAKWLARVEATERRNAFLRMYCNQWVSAEGEFVPLDWVRAAMDPSWNSLGATKATICWAGLDIGLKRDQTALTVVTYDHEDSKVKLVEHKVWQGSFERPVDFRLQIEPMLLDVARRYTLISLWVDPHQAEELTQRMRAHGLQVVSFAQTPDNLTAMGSNLYTLLQSRSLLLYPDDTIWKGFAAATAVEIPGRGFKITKHHRADKVDVVVALAMAALAASRGGATASSAAIHAAATGDWRNYDTVMGERLDTVSAARSAREQRLMREAASDAWSPGRGW